MNVKRFFAPSTREALRALKAELGADAIVLSSRSVEGGVEILALPPGAIGTLHTPDAAPSDSQDDFRVTLSQLAANSVPRPSAHRSPEIRSFTPPRVDARTETRQPAQKTPPKPPVETRDEHLHVLQQTNARLMDEIAGIRGVIEREFASLAWHETTTHAPVRAQMLGQLLSMGFSPALSRSLISTLDKDASAESAFDILRASMGRSLKISAGTNEIIDGGGVFALVGPTGVGKTTTVAKLAARFVARHGANRLALITTDGYRIGAQEQLRIYGRILGVPVFAVRDAAECRQTLLDLRGKHMVLIDTMGMNQRDRLVATQTNMLAEMGPVRRLLLLNATSQGGTLDDVVKAFIGPDVAGCIFTKVDEAASLAPVLDTALRHELNVRYVTDGQRVPEDLHLPNRARLLQRALHSYPDESPWRLDKEETGAMLRAQGA